jgi:hypothetical protein
MSAITPGQHIGAWEILSVDPSGKRACQGDHYPEHHTEKSSENDFANHGRLRLQDSP